MIVAARRIIPHTQRYRFSGPTRSPYYLCIRALGNLIHDAASTQVFTLYR